jgi:hypothetical protein
VTVQDNTEEFANLVLMEALGFTAEDLKANRRGKLSKTQTKLHKEMRAVAKEIARQEMPPWQMLIFFVVLFACVGGVLFVTGILQAVANFAGVFAPAVFGVVVIGLVWFLVSGYGRHQRYLEEIAQELEEPNLPALQSVTGKATYLVKGPAPGSQYSERYYAIIENREFRIPWFDTTVFRENRVYRVYFIHYAETDFLLSAEFVEDATGRTKNAQEET